MYSVVNQEESGSHGPFLGPDHEEDIWTEDVVNSAKRPSHRIKLSQIIIHTSVALTYILLTTAIMFCSRDKGVVYHVGEGLYCEFQFPLKFSNIQLKVSSTCSRSYGIRNKRT